MTTTVLHYQGDRCQGWVLLVGGGAAGPSHNRMETLEESPQKSQSIQLELHAREFLGSPTLHCQ